ncbi:MAG: PSD1 and planctomycete cytochrome C domain-containing protein [Gemmataceae bacterium]|nr:PSD1 and planctomycete cytochrome C domain-containing protein [Gemmataceae bacterium]
MSMPLLPRRGRWLILVGTATLGTLLLIQGESPQPAKADGPLPPAKTAIDFSRHIRPLLSENCFSCHGPDDKSRKAKLRLDTKDGAFAELRGGGFAIVAGKSAESALIERIVTTDPKKLMPPPQSNKHLKPEQIALLKQWIDQGAPWSEHWAFVTPKKPTSPAVKNVTWSKNPIDPFILARLEAKGLQPTPEADKARLIRRVTLDLTGLPPSGAEVDAFLADNSAEAYEKVVDRLLKSPRFGEHMARFWLDAARYGDTHGLHLDNYREMWPYREWVINAFNRNLPFDQFIVEQLAGDLLPKPTQDQVIASGFNRCHVTTSEGGTIAEEAYVRNVLDRVETTGIVFFGLTVGCARCHDHKYDPVRMKDFYQLFAFFNSLDNNPLDGNATQHPPILRLPTPEQTASLEKLKTKGDALRKTIAEELAKVAYDDKDDAAEPEQQKPADYVWIDDDVPAGAKSASDGSPDGRWNFVGKPNHPVHSGTKSILRTADGLAQQFFTDANPGLKVGQGDKLFAHVYLKPDQLPKTIMLQWNVGGAWNHRAYWGENAIPWGKDNSAERLPMGALPKAGEWVRLEVDTAKLGLKPGTAITGWAFTQHGGTVYWDKAGIVTKTPQGKQTFDKLSTWVAAQRANAANALPKPIQDIVKLDPAKRGDAQKKELREYFIVHAYAKTRETFDPLNKQLSEVEKERDAIDKQVPATYISQESPQPKPAFILKRGEYDQKGDPVSRDVPAFLPPMAANTPRNRLGFAQWLVAPNHPMTARVAVNRFWQQCFGVGLVKTAEDFGSQGEPPTHPELLDWLAVQFQDDGWDVKKTMKRIVTSATYRQASRVTKDRLLADPANRLLSRGPRFRLDAEMLRDQALFTSGLLVEKIGGPSVKPPQPGGLWEAVGYTDSNTAKFFADKGHDKVHRRSLYTFWKRTSPPPQMTSFDAPSRESCTVRRERTNTPLQALLLLNETQFVECARALAERTLRDGGKDAESRLAFLFQQATARKPGAGEMAVLMETLNGHLATYRKDVDAAKRLINVGETKPDDRLDLAELAAWTMLANLALNLDEVISKG